MRPVLLLLLLAGCARDAVDCVEATPDPVTVRGVIGTATDAAVLVAWTCAGPFDLRDVRAVGSALEVVPDDRPAGSSPRSLGLIYRPPDPTPDAAEVVLTVGPDGDEVVLPVTGQPLGLDVWPPDTVFTDVGCEAAAAVPVTNAGPAPTTLTASFTRPAGAWRIAPAAPSDLAAGETVEVPLTFRPTAAVRTESVRLRLSSGEGHVTSVALVGVGEVTTGLEQTFPVAGEVGPLLHPPVPGSLAITALPGGEEVTAFDVLGDRRIRFHLDGLPPDAERVFITYDRVPACEIDGS